MLSGHGHTLVVAQTVCSTQKPLEEEGSEEDKEILVYGCISSVALPSKCVFQATADSQRRKRMKRVV